MVPKTTRTRNNTPVFGKLYLAFELSESEWKLGFTIGLGQAARLRAIKARSLEGLKREIEQAKVRFGLPKETAVLSCYEAGRDGFSRRTSGRCGYIVIWKHKGSTTW